MITIIDKIKPPSKILEYKPKPSFRSTYEKEKYWDGEKKKWIEGVGDIPGTFYHYIQEQFIKDRLTGKIQRPDARFVDLIIHNKIQEIRNKKRSLGIIKGRGLGLSTIGGGSLPNYFMRTNPGSTCLITSREQKNISTIFSDKLMVTFNKYDDDIRPEITNINSTKDRSFLKTSILFKNDYGQADIAESKVICSETSERPSSVNSFSGEGSIYGFYDEFPLHKRKTEVLKSSKECYRNPNTGELDGFLLWGGTVEETLSSEEIAEFQILIKDANMWQTDVLFIPYWMNKFLINGHPDKKKAKEWYDKNIDELSKADDKSLLVAFRKNNPASIEDIFNLSNDGRWEQDVHEKIKMQRELVVKENVPVTKCFLVEIGGTIHTKTTNIGNVSIIEHPKKNVDYYLLVDGVATGKNTSGETKDHSSVAGVIVKMFDGLDDLNYAPVCIYCERPDTVEQSYWNLINQAKYYNMYGGLSGIMAEANAGMADHFSTFLSNHGMKKYAMNRKDLSGKGNSNTKSVFNYVNDVVRDYQIRQANIFLRKYVHNIKMLSLLDDMLKNAKENTDILDAWLMFFVACKDFDKPVVKKNIEKKEIEHVILKRKSDGTTYWGTIKVFI